jgi:hypothetical protein
MNPGRASKRCSSNSGIRPLARCAIWGIATGSHVLADPTVDTAQRPRANDGILLAAGDAAGSVCVYDLGGRFPPLIVHCLTEVEVLFPSADGSTLHAVDDGGATGCRLPYIFRLERPPSGLPARL